MLIHNFINNISSKKEKNSKTIKQLHTLLKRVHYTSQRHQKLLSHDAVANSNYIKGGKVYSNHWIMPDESYRNTQIKLSIPYMVEKFLVFSNCGNLKDNEDIDDTELFNTVYNSFLNAGEIEKDKDHLDFASKLLFSLYYEQFEIQKPYNIELETFRLLNLYKSFPEVSIWFIDKFGVSFEEFYTIAMSLIILINKQEKPIGNIPINEFIQFAKVKESITNDKIQSFIDYIVIGFDTFIQKYHDLRTSIGSNGIKQKLTYEKLQQVDKYIPKLSFLYPILLNEQKTHLLIISYTSLFMFLRFERIYLDIYHNKDIPKFKSNIHGYAVNDYVKRFIETTIDHSVKLYGDEKYFPMKDNGKLSKIERHAPDVIVEYEHFVIFIECKSKPFDLMKALIHFDEYKFDKIFEEAQTSETNIMNYLKYVNSFPRKKKYKLVSYFFPNPAMLNIATAKACKLININDIVITDIRTIETLFLVKGISLDLILDEFLTLPSDNIGLSSKSLNQFLLDNYYEYIDQSAISKKVEEELKEYFKA